MKVLILNIKVGRWSSSRPAVQNLPRTEEFVPGPWEIIGFEESNHPSFMHQPLEIPQEEIERAMEEQLRRRMNHLAHPEVFRLGLCRCDGDYRCDPCLKQFLAERSGDTCECGQSKTGLPQLGPWHSSWCKMWRSS